MTSESVEWRCDETTMRGRIWRFVARHAAQLEAPVLEVGANHQNAPWARFRDLRQDLEWLGVDKLAGHGVDRVLDAELVLPWPQGTFGSCVCAETLEHVWSPGSLLRHIRDVLRPGGLIVVTTLFAFRLHGPPKYDDWWRFTPACLRRLLEEAGFGRVEVEVAGAVDLSFDDHGEGGVMFSVPIHVFAVARAS